MGYTPYLLRVNYSTNRTTEFYNLEISLHGQFQYAYHTHVHAQDGSCMLHPTGYTAKALRGHCHARQRDISNRAICVKTCEYPRRLANVHVLRKCATRGCTSEISQPFPQRAQVLHFCLRCTWCRLFLCWWHLSEATRSTSSPGPRRRFWCAH